MTARWIAALAFAVVAAGLSQTRPAANPGTSKTHTRTSPAAPDRRSDAEIERDLRARLARSKIAADGFTAHVQGGVATLEGRTDVLQHKGTATRLAKNAGATQVVNRIQVSQAARDRAAKNLATGRRRAQVKRGEPRSEPRQ